jgi:hypothetical protein
MLRLLVFALFAVPVFGTDPAPPTVRMPEAQAVVAPPDSVTTLSMGQWYIVDADTEQMLGTYAFDNVGEVTITKKKGPYVVPSLLAIGRKPDADDPDTVTIKGPFIYVIKAKTTGKILLDVLPTVNKLDAAGKPIPFTDKDVIRRVLDVHGPQPVVPPVVVPPVVVPPVVVPPTPVVLNPFQLKVQAAYKASGATPLELATYAALWRGAATTTVYADALKTPAAVMAEFEASALNLSKGNPPSVRHGILLGVAQVVAAEIAPFMPTPATGTLTPATRDGLRDLFLRISKDLDTVGGAK